MVVAYSSDAHDVRDVIFSVTPFVASSVAICAELLALHYGIFASLNASPLHEVSTGKSVGCPALSHGEEHHVFLSHVWKSGQDQVRVIKSRLLLLVPDLKVFLDVDSLDSIADLELHMER